jgi:hypothetical protein
VVFNPFYALIAQKLASYKHSFQITLKFGLWDFMKEIESASIRRVSHLAKFFAFLVSGGTIPLTALKKFNFLSSSPKETLFLQYMLAKIILDSSDSQLANVFRQISSCLRNVDACSGDPDSSTEEQQFIQSGLKIFIRFQMEKVSLPFIKDEKAFENRLEAVKAHLT